jgi:protein-tyrosine phosphatase
MVAPDMLGRMDVHAHLLPAIDDGCASTAESIECARALVQAGYSHVICTPHVWPNLPHNNPGEIVQRVADLQTALDRSGVPLKLIPGGEMNFRADLDQLPPESLVTVGLQRRYVMLDIWVDKLPEWFPRIVRWMQSQGLTVVLAHPERMRAVQDDWSLIDTLQDMGLLFQGNLQCLADPPHTATRATAEHMLTGGRYFVLGSDLHKLEGLHSRFQGLNNAIALVGSGQIDRLTRENPRKMLGGDD